MKKTDLKNTCAQITKMHTDDLKKEISKIIKESRNESDSSVELIANILVKSQVNQIEHSIQAVTDVLVNVGLLEIEDD